MNPAGESTLVSRLLLLALTLGFLVVGLILIRACRISGPAPPKPPAGSVEPTGAVATVTPTAAPVQIHVEARAATNAQGTSAPPRVEAVTNRPVAAATNRAVAAGTNRPQAAPAEVLVVVKTNAIVLPAIGGRVMLSGKPPPETAIEMDPICGAFSRTSRLGIPTTRAYVVNAQRGLANVLVWLKNGTPGAPREDSPLLEQHGCMLEPYMIAVVAGQKFRVRNNDPVLHTLHVTPRINREFTQFHGGQPQPGYVHELSFAYPERFISLKCDVHPWMSALVSVFEHPFFAITDTNGVFRLSGFPPGRYQVAAAHPKAGEVTREIEVKAGEQQTLEIELTVPSEIRAQSP